MPIVNDTNMAWQRVTTEMRQQSLLIHVVQRTKDTLFE